MIIANIPNALHVTFMRTKHPLEIRMMFVHVPVNIFKPSNVFLLSKMVLLFRFFSLLSFLFHVCLCYAVLPVPCRLVITCWLMADLLAFMRVEFRCHFPIRCSVSGMILQCIDS